MIREGKCIVVVNGLFPSRPEIMELLQKADFVIPDGAISVKGLRYPIENRRLHSWGEATLNEAIGHEFAVILHEEARILVYRQW